VPFPNTFWFRVGIQEIKPLFYWCFSNNAETDQVKEDTNNYDAGVKELSKT
jgi:hypothetical protein